MRFPTTEQAGTVSFFVYGAVAVNDFQLMLLPAMRSP